MPIFLNVDGGELQVTRWSKFGHQRLYVIGPDGLKVGWHDLVTGEDTSITPS